MAPPDVIEAATPTMEGCGTSDAVEGTELLEEEPLVTSGIADANTSQRQLKSSGDRSRGHGHRKNGGHGNRHGDETKHHGGHSKHHDGDTKHHGGHTKHHGGVGKHHGNAELIHGESNQQTTSNVSVPSDTGSQDPVDDPGKPGKDHDDKKQKSTPAQHVPNVFERNNLDENGRRPGSNQGGGQENPPDSGNGLTGPLAGDFSIELP